MDHGEEVVGQFVVARRYTAEVLQLREESFDQVTLAIQPHAEARFPFSIGFRRYVGRRALFLDQRPDAICIIGLVREDDHMRPEMIEQFIGHLTIMRLASGQAEPDREALGIDDRMDFGSEPTWGATETMISIPLFAVAACWWTRTEVLSII